METKGVGGISSAIRTWHGRHDCPVMAEVEIGRGLGVLRAVLKCVPLGPPGLDRCSSLLGQSEHRGGGPVLSAQ